MSRPKVALLISPPGTARIFTTEAYVRLRELVDLSASDENSHLRPEQCRVLLSGSVVCITSWGTPRLTKELLDAAPDLKLVVHAAGSVKPIVSDELFQRGITITNGAPAIAIGVAETALGLIIVSMKNIFELARSTAEKGWNKDLGPKSRVLEMCQTTVGIVGAGHVGRHLLGLLRHFSVRVLLYDPTLQANDATALGATLVDLDTLMRESDVISLHAPSLPATYHMINAERLKLMKDHAAIINTARGSLIDEQALAKELSSGRIRACLDVTDPEPPAADSLLRTYPNVVMIPHVAGCVTTGRLRLGEYVLQELQRFLAGKPAMNPVSEDQLAYLA